jgi:transposase
VVMKVYSPEFKADAVALYVNSPGRTIRSVADDLGVNHETLRNWISAHRARRREQAADGTQTPDSGGPVSSGNMLEKENKQLRARIRELETEREILRRAAKYFAGETNW